MTQPPLHATRDDQLKFAYWVPNVSGGLVTSDIEQRTSWDFDYNVRLAQAADTAWVRLVLGGEGDGTRVEAVESLTHDIRYLRRSEIIADVLKDRILEIAVVVTDAQLNVRVEGPVIAVHQSDAVLDGMDDWNKNTHGKSGLTDRVRASTIDEAAAELTLTTTDGRTVQVNVENAVGSLARPMSGAQPPRDRERLRREDQEPAREQGDQRQHVEVDIGHGPK